MFISQLHLSHVITNSVRPLHALNHSSTIRCIFTQCTWRLLGSSHTSKQHSIIHGLVIVLLLLALVTKTAQNNWIGIFQNKIPRALF